ncbi:hypothetical protein Golob_006200, partial [Gossypium lobatum]|nr:hypothetical protein [Gossypium lobatum]
MFHFFSTTVYANSYSQQHFDTGGLSRESFPKRFLFGTAALEYQGMASKDGRGPMHLLKLQDILQIMILVKFLLINIIGIRYL